MIFASGKSPNDKSFLTWTWLRSHWKIHIWMSHFEWLKIALALDSTSFFSSKRQDASEWLFVYKYAFHLTWFLFQVKETILRSKFNIYFYDSLHVIWVLLKNCEKKCGEKINKFSAKWNVKRKNKKILIAKQESVADMDVKLTLLMQVILFFFPH